MDGTGAEGEEDEEEDDVDQSEVQRRKERLEREQWLREQVILRDLHTVNSEEPLMEVYGGPVWLSCPLSSDVGGVVVVCLHSFLCLSSQSEQSAKKGEDLDADDEKIGEEDSHFMKLAKKLTAKTLQRKGLFDSRPHKKSVLFFRPVIIIVLESKQIRGNKTHTRQVF